jgi:hypothetical protein
MNGILVNIAFAGSKYLHAVYFLSIEYLKINSFFEITTAQDAEA